MRRTAAIKDLMDSLDDYFEYAMDLPERDRNKLLSRLRHDDPLMAERLQAALGQMVKNPDFLCQNQDAPHSEDQEDRLQRVTIRVGNLERAKKWYTEVFRCSLVRSDANRVVLSFTTIELHLVADENEPPSVSILRPDVAKMGPSERRNDGVRSLRMVDPWGNAIEVIDRP
jgi:hypothetical protein